MNPFGACDGAPNRSITKSTGDIIAGCDRAVLITVQHLSHPAMKILRNNSITGCTCIEHT